MSHLPIKFTVFKKKTYKPLLLCTNLNNLNECRDGRVAGRTRFMHSHRRFQKNVSASIVLNHIVKQILHSNVFGLFTTELNVRFFYI